MASNTRSSIKWIRDYCKSKYVKDTKCAICAKTTELEFHHYHSVSLLVHNYAKENSLDFSNKDIILENREAFLNTHWHEMIEDTVTLCKPHHLALHSVYGEVPVLTTASKQSRWVELQRKKLQGEDLQQPQDEVFYDNSLTRFCTQSKSLFEFIVRGN